MRTKKTKVVKTPRTILYAALDNAERYFLAKGREDYEVYNAAKEAIFELAASKSKLR